MVGQVVSLFTCALLLLCFVAFSVASFRHFDPATDSTGNLVIRGLTLCGTVLNAWLVSMNSPVTVAYSVLGIAFGCASFSVFRAALRSAPAGKFHVAFTGSGPDELVTSGVYGRIRNPLYTSYLAYWAAWVPATGLHPLSVACFVLFCVLYWLAVREEERFLTHQFGEQYLAFQSRTGRFLPRVGAQADASRS